MAIIALLGIFSAQASAAYNSWTINGEPSETTAYEEFAGQFRLTPEITQGPAAGSVLYCDATFTVEADPGSAQGHLSSFDFDLESCEGLGIWEGCEGESYEGDIADSPVDMGSTPTTFGGEDGFFYKVFFKEESSYCPPDWKYAYFPNPQEMTPILNEQGRVVSFKLDGVPNGEINKHNFGTFDATGKYVEEYGELGLE